jgi:hypothetical protein
MGLPAMMTRQLQQAAPAVDLAYNADYENVDLTVGGEVVGPVVTDGDDIDHFYLLISAYLLRPGSTRGALSLLDACNDCDADLLFAAGWNGRRTQAGVGHTARGRVRKQTHAAVGRSASESRR